MKLLILACFLGYAAASFLQEAEPAVDESVLAFLEGAEDVCSLREAIGSDDHVFADIEDDIKTAIAEKTKETFLEFLQRVKEAIEKAKHVSHELLEKFKEWHQKFKDTKIDLGENAKKIIEELKNKAKEILKKLVKEIGSGKPNLDHMMDAVARLKFSEFVEAIKEKIRSSEFIQKIREYIRNLETDHPFLQKVKELEAKLQDVDIREILEHLFEHRIGRSTRALRSETWDKVKDFFKDLKIKIGEHSKKFGEWVKEMWGKGIDKLKEKHGAIKAIAMEFISHTKDMSSEMAREALEFFRPYKDDLGALWKQIVDAAKEAIGKF